jgi:hypothetical protein
MHLQWFTIKLADGRVFSVAAHDLQEAKKTLEDGFFDDLLYGDEGLEPKVTELVANNKPDTKLYTVFGIYTDNRNQRFGFVAKAQSPDDAEQLATNYGTYACCGDPVIACVLEGRHAAVDEDPVLQGGPQLEGA